MNAPDGSQSLCAAFDQFSQPAAFIHLGEGTFVAWNMSFRKLLGYQPGELESVNASTSISFDENAVISEAEELQTQVVPCSARGVDSARVWPGRAWKKGDQFALVLLDAESAHTGDEAFAKGHLQGQGEERRRILQLFHDLVSSQIVAAAFAAHHVEQVLASKGLPESEEISKVTKLLEQTIENVQTAFLPERREEHP